MERLTKNDYLTIRSAIDTAISAKEDQIEREIEYHNDTGRKIDERFLRELKEVREKVSQRLK